MAERGSRGERCEVGQMGGAVQDCPLYPKRLENHQSIAGGDIIILQICVHTDTYDTVSKDASLTT